MTIDVLTMLYKARDLGTFSAVLAKKTNFYVRDSRGKTILMHVVSTALNKRPPNHQDFVKFLVENGGGVLINATQNTLKKTALMYAAEINDEAGVVYLLENGADLNAEDYSGQNALGAALSAKCYLTAEILLRRGIDIKNEIGFDKNIDQFIFNILWDSLKTMPEEIPSMDRAAFRDTNTEGNELSPTEPTYIERENLEEYLVMAKKHNEDLSNLPGSTGMAVAEQTPLPQALAILVSSYISTDETYIDNFDTGFNTQKGIMFSGSAANEPQNPSNTQTKVRANEIDNPSLSHDKKRKIKSR